MSWRRTVSWWGLVLGAWLMAPAAWALPVVVEGFDTDASGWVDQSAAGPAAHQASGGPAGAGDGYITQLAGFASAVEGDTPVLLRSGPTAGPQGSGGAFMGDWIGTGVTELTFSVRHDFYAPLNVFTRVASLNNFPGAVAVEFVPVLPDTWTDITIAIDPANPAFVTFEGSSFAAVFSNVGILQFGVDVSAALAGSPVPVSFDVGAVTVVPEPSTAVLVGLGLAIASASRRRRAA